MESFEAIYEKYYKKIYLFLYRLSGNHSVSEELTQETLYKAFLHMEQYEGRCSIYTWLCQIAKNNWFAECNRQRRLCEPNADWEPVSGNDFEQKTIEKQMLLLLRQEINKLPEPYVSVCTLRLYAELSFTEIAAEYGKSESWARVTYFRGKTLLTERMEKYQ